MNNFLSGSAFTLSLLALALSGFAVFKVTTLEDPVSNQVSVSAPSETLPEASTESPSSLLETASSELDDGEIPPPEAEQSLTPIQPGQFVLQAYNNQVTVELVSLKRRKSNEGLPVDTVILEFRLRRDLEDLADNSYIVMWQTKARNPENREEYTYVSKKVTKNVYLKNLPVGAWADAYVWLKVPQEVNQVDVVMPEGNPIFRGVPIEG